MNWIDEGFLISKNRYSENSLIAEIFTKNRGKISGIIFGGTSKKIKNYLQIGNRLHINYSSKSENRIEFPGGKLEIGETPENALIRELKEELAIETEASCFAPFTFASHSYQDFNLLLALFVCRKWSGIVTPLECQTIKWVKPKSLKHFDMPPADKPLIAMLRDFL